MVLQGFVYAQLTHLQHVLRYAFCAFLPLGHGTGPEPGAAFSKDWLVGYWHEYVSEVRLGLSLMHWAEKDPLEETDLEDSNVLESQWDKILSKKFTFQLWG